MPWYIRDILRHEGVITITDIGVEVVIIELSNMTNYYMVVGYLNLSNMQRGDELLVKEYMDLGLGVYNRYISARFKDKQDDPIVMITPKYFTDYDKYKLTITQTAGVPRQIPYKILVFLYEQAV